ncbi:MAG: DUF86 domain-containing protein [Nitrospira sp.]|nr:DUF86 domain-containing protein [Nitrospira sp.]
MELVDKLLLGRKLTQMETYLDQIREYSKISVTAYKNDWKIQRIVERTLQILIELCIDIANHLISDKGMSLPTSYADTFKVLTENRIISKNLFKTMEKMAKFRNIVVHQYEKIEPSIVVSILHKNLDDFEKYKRAIIKYLSN